MKNHVTSKELKISLAQWSLHRSFNAGELDPKNFATIAKNTYNISAVEYVNQFYTDEAGQALFWKEMKKRAEDQGVQSLLIMVDDEGLLGDGNKKRRVKAVENHYKWVEAASILDCHSVRVNAFGADKRELFRTSIVDGMGRLCEFAAPYGLNVLIENHGLYSSEGAFIADIIREVNMENLGTFPDFGNWCTSAKWGSTQIDCEKIYEPVQGVTDFLPFAKAVSAKSYNFDDQGRQLIINYEKLLKLVKDSNYDGFIGIEYEGENLSEHDGILATKKLMEDLWPIL